MTGYGPVFCSPTDSSTPAAGGAAVPSTQQWTLRFARTPCTVHTCFFASVLVVSCVLCHTSAGVTIARWLCEVCLYGVWCYLHEGDGQRQLSQAGICHSQMPLQDPLAGRQLTDALEQSLQAAKAGMFYSAMHARAQTALHYLWDVKEIWTLVQGHHLHLGLHPTAGQARPGSRDCFCRHQWPREQASIGAQHHQAPKRRYGAAAECTSHHG